MTTKTTNATTVRLSKEERAKMRAEKQQTPAFTNMKVRVNNKDELVITIPAKEFRTSKLVQGDNLEKAIAKYGTTKNGNILFGATYEYVGLDVEDFENVIFNLSVVTKTKAVKEAIEDRKASEKLKEMANKKSSEQVPAMDMAEYQEFLEFKKWKAMMAQQGK